MLLYLVLVLVLVLVWAVLVLAAVVVVAVVLDETIYNKLKPKIGQNTIILYFITHIYIFYLNYILLYVIFYGTYSWYASHSLDVQRENVKHDEEQ